MQKLAKPVVFALALAPFAWLVFRALTDRLSVNPIEDITLTTGIWALRFLVMNRDRSIKLATEGLGPRPFHRRVVILTNEHTLSAGEMAAASTSSVSSFLRASDRAAWLAPFT